MLLLVCIGGLSAYLAHFFRENYVSNLEAQLTDQARLVGDAGEPYLLSAVPGALDALTKRLGGQIDARVTIIDPGGNVLGDSQEDPSTMDNHSDRPEFRQAMESGTGSNIRRSETLGYDMIYVATRITPDGQVLGVARVSLPLTEINAAMGHVNGVITAGAVVAALLGILLAFQLARLTTEPVKRLTMASKDMAEGRLDHQVVATSRDEVGDLARAFNRMAQKQKEAVALTTAERDRLAVLLESLQDAIFVVGADGRVTMVNQAAGKLADVPRNETTGRTFIEVMRDYEVDVLLQECLSKNEQRTGLVELKARKRFVRVLATPFAQEGGCLLLIQDLTDLRKMETTRRDFVANLSHELRTPVTSLKALGETLREGAIEDRAVARDFLDKINVETDRLAQMVEEMGELSRIESGAAPLQKGPVDLAGVADRAASRLKAQADRAGVRLEIRVPGGLPGILADEGRIEQVLINLVHNAIKFTPAGGLVTVSARVEGNSLVTAVSDTGVGIPEDDLPRVFERFYKADKARAGGGTGLGLAIARHIVEAHGGRIWAESVEGRGATFSFSLPLAPPG